MKTLFKGPRDAVAAMHKILDQILKLSYYGYNVCRAGEMLEMAYSMEPNYISACNLKVH